MTSLYIPLGMVDQNKVRVFEASVSAPKGEKGYFISYMVVTKEFDPENKSVVWNKHTRFEDYAQRFRSDAPRRCLKAEKTAIEVMENNLPYHVAAACKMYGVRFPSLKDATESFSRPVFEAYRDQVLGLDLENQQIIQGFEAALEFCKDFNTEDDQSLEVFTYPFATTYKIAQLVKHFCTRLHRDEKWDALLNHRVNLDRIGMCIYYGVKGHGTGFFDEPSLTDDKELLEYLDTVLKEMYLDVFVNNGLLVMDALINKVAVKA
ncbi:MAG: hypothetical protein RR280_01080 [Bacteroidaceae bacterium]